MVSSLGGVEQASGPTVIQLAVDLEVDDSRRLHIRQIRKDDEFGEAVLEVVKAGLKTNKRGVRRKSWGSKRSPKGG